MTAIAAPGDACPRPAEWIIFRGRHKRLWLCGECKITYDGRGRIEAYATEEELGPPGGLPPVRKVFTGPARRCGEAAGE